MAQNKTRMAAAEGSMTTRLKLMVDTKANKVMFAEADKPFVDFLGDIMSMPISTIVALLKEKGMVGSLANLYNSFDALSADYYAESKDLMLHPRTGRHIPLLSLFDASPILYSCSSHGEFTTFPGQSCSNGGYPCKGALHKSSSKYVAPRAGYVKELVKYVVSDNLEVNPLTTSFIRSLSKDLTALLEERDVEVGLDEGLALLKASFETEAVLSAVFLRKKAKRELV